MGDLPEEPPAAERTRVLEHSCGPSGWVPVMQLALHGPELPEAEMSTDQQTRKHLIRPASGADLERLLWIEQRSFSTPWTRKMFEAELAGNPFSHLLTARPILGAPAEDGAGEIVGYICFWVVFEELRLMNLAVEASVRRQGIATDLVRHALSVGGTRKAQCTQLEVRVSNVAARALYERLGFRQVAVRTRYYTGPIEDAILMERAEPGHQSAG